MTPKISIITITYNSESSLEETIQSIVSQNYPNLEYLIIDGGSKDGTLNIVDKYRDKIAVVVSEPDNGISDAFNKGIRYASGEIIGIINSDDILLPGALQSIADNYEKDIDVYSGKILFWNDATGETFEGKPALTFDKLKLQYAVAHPGRFIRKDAYEKYGDYMVNMRYNMDIELLCRFYHQGAKFKLVDKCLAKFRMGGTTADPIFKKKEDYRLFVESFGGTQKDFKKIWRKAVAKYRLIKLSYTLFGNDFKFKLRNNKFMRRFFLPVVKKLQK